MKTVIFACVHNAGRSQMAAAFFNALASRHAARAISAGTRPAECVHPEVVQVMLEVGLDLSAAKPQKLDADMARGAFLLITMGCGDECPVVPGLRRADWPLDDPKGQPAERIRELREDIRSRVERLVHQEGWLGGTVELSAKQEWQITHVAGGASGDLFALVVEKSTAFQVTTTVLVRASSVQRRVLGGFVVPGYEHTLAVVDGGGEATRPLLLLAHSRDEAPLTCVDFFTGQQLWEAPGLRGAIALESRRASRFVGASFRTGARLVNADTGKFRLPLKGSVGPLIAESAYAIALEQGRHAYAAVYRIEDGSKVFQTPGKFADAAFIDDIIVLAGRGLHAMDLGGRKLWSFEPGTSFSQIRGLADGVRSISLDRGVIDVGRDGGLLREHSVSVDRDEFLGSDLVISDRAVHSIVGQGSWEFAGEVKNCAEEALAIQSDATPVATSEGVEPQPERVFHSRFGRGTVLRQADGKTWVKFDDGAERVLATRFLSPADA